MYADEFIFTKSELISQPLMEHQKRTAIIRSSFCLLNYNCCTRLCRGRGYVLGILCLYRFVCCRLCIACLLYTSDAADD